MRGPFAKRRAEPEPPPAELPPGGIVLPHEAPEVIAKGEARRAAKAKLDAVTGELTATIERAAALKQRAMSTGDVDFDELRAAEAEIPALDLKLRMARWDADRAAAEAKKAHTAAFAEAQRTYGAYVGDLQRTMLDYWAPGLLDIKDKVCIAIDEGQRAGLILGRVGEQTWPLIDADVIERCRRAFRWLPAAGAPARPDPELFVEVIVKRITATSATPGDRNPLEGNAVGERCWLRRIDLPPLLRQFPPPIEIVGELPPELQHVPKAPPPADAQGHVKVRFVNEGFMARRPGGSLRFWQAGEVDYLSQAEAWQAIVDKCAIVEPAAPEP